MNGQKNKPKEESQKVPTWIVSFSDMITLLLAFFVLLQAFAHTQDPELFYIGQGSFKRAIAGLGIPTLFLGKQDPPLLDFRKLRYPTEEQPEKVVRNKVLDAKDEKFRQAFSELKKSIQTQSSDLMEKPIRIMDTPIRFARGSSLLDPAARDYVAELVVDLKQNLSGSAYRIYIVGLASEKISTQRQWILSAQRARAVEQYLGPRLTRGQHKVPTQIHSWGSGSEGQWFRAFGLDPEDSFIMIAIMKR